MNGTVKNQANSVKQTAMSFVILLGVVSLFADMTYEGARSITGPYLAVLGASGAVVGFVAGFGELIGYGLRLLSGYLSDRTGRYWAFTLAGYGLNLLVVPLLALAGRWEIAAALIIAERVGKALRTPARDAMLSHATREMGRGWGFGLHEAMDQIGAMLGPLIVAAVLVLRGSYEAGFAVLLLPALLALAVLAAARWLYPRPQDLEMAVPVLKTKGLPGCATGFPGRFLPCPGGHGPLGRGDGSEGVLMNRYLLIAIGAALGANARYLVGIWAGNRLGADFPYGTFVVNVTGSFVLGFLLALGTERLQLSPEARLLLVVGFLGSFTTFSSYTMESLNLLRDAGLGRSLLNVAGNNLVGLLAAVLGAGLARWVQGGG